MKERDLQLDAEELQILQDFECGEFESVQNFREEKRKLEFGGAQHASEG
jgi:hypothetical protein